MEHDDNLSAPPSDHERIASLETGPISRRGPLLKFSAAGIIAIILSIPLIVPKSLAVKDDPKHAGRAVWQW